MQTKPEPATAYERKFAENPLSSVDQSGTFSGYASLFGAVDLGKEIVQKGAFAKSIALKGAENVRLLFQHNPDEPVGRWIKIAEDSKGLFVKGQLNLDVTRAREVHSLMLEGAINGLSIGFKTIRSRKEHAGGVRRILEADLWEISIVTFPMLPGARIDNVKTGKPLPTRREFERWLVRDAGLSRGQAKMVIAKGFAAIAGERDVASDATDARMAEKIRQAARRLTTR